MISHGAVVARLDKKKEFMFKRSASFQFPIFASITEIVLNNNATFATFVLSPIPDIFPNFLFLLFYDNL